MRKKISHKIRLVANAVLRFINKFLRGWWLPSSLIILYILINFIKLELVPDLLKVSLIKASAYFSVIIGATASVFGILITVVLLTFELVKHNLFKRSEENILTNPIITNFISLGVITLLLSLVSYIVVQDFSQVKNITIAYFIGYLFSFFILSIYPTMKVILYSTSGLKKAQKLIDELKPENFKIIDFDTNSISLLEDNSTPLYGIRTELISALRENDFEAYNLMLRGFNFKVMNLMGDGMDRRLMQTIQHGLTLVWKGGNLEALRVGNYQYFDSIWESTLSLYVNAISERHPFLHYQEIEFYIRDFISFLNRNKLHDNLATGAKVLSNVFRFSLEGNCPDQESLMDLYSFFQKEDGTGHNVDASLQWDDIEEFLNSIFEIQKIAIENGDKNLYEICHREIRVLLSRIAYHEFPNLKKLQEGYLVINIIRKEISNAETAGKASLFENQYMAYRLEVHMLDDAIKNNELYVEYILPTIADFIIIAQRNKQLESFGLLHDWGTLARLISQYYKHNALSQKASNYIVDTLEILKKEIENNQLPEQSKNYDEVKSIFKSLRSTLVEDNGESVSELINRIDKILKNFMEVQRIKDFRIVKWE